MKPIWKILIVVGVVIGLVVILTVVPHYRAKAAVAAYRELLKKQGEKTSVEELTPELSAEEVKAGKDLLSAVGGVGEYKDWPPSMRWVAPGHVVVAWAETILPTQDSTNCWPSLNEILRRHPEASESLRTALQSPGIGFPLNYAGGFSLLLTHLSPLKRASIWLAVSAMTEMHEGDITNAWKDLRAEANLVRLNRSEPLMISQLVRIAMMQIALSAMWEALQYPGWSEAQLAELQTNWDSFDMLDHLEASFAMERVTGEVEFAEFRSSYSNYVNLVSLTILGGGGPRYDNLGELLASPVEGVKAHLRYRAWKSWASYEEEVFTMQIWQAAAQAARRARKKEALGPELNNFNVAVTNIQNGHPGWEKRFAFANLGLFGEGMASQVTSYLTKAADAEMARRMLVTAIALKRFQLQQGKYPTQLTELTPNYLKKVPIDSMDGKPLRYRLKDDGVFLLYSVGEDGKDDGGDGSPLPTDTSEHKQWYKMRDAVWPSPATPEEVKKYEATEMAKAVKKVAGKLLPQISVPESTNTDGKTN